MRLDHAEDVAAAVVPLMAGFGAPWCVAGGWALDLFLGRVTRQHSDVELAVFRPDQALLHRKFPGWAFTVSVDGRREPWQDGEVLELPLHEIHAYSPDEPPRSIEFLLNERDEGHWIFRRDPEIVLPLDRAIVGTALGVEVLGPEIVLLYKSKAPRPKDEIDFRTVHPVLSDEGRTWLRSALLATDAHHPWVPVLDGAVS